MSSRSVLLLLQLEYEWPCITIRPLEFGTDNKIWVDFDTSLSVAAPLLNLEKIDFLSDLTAAISIYRRMVMSEHRLKPTRLEFVLMFYTLGIPNPTLKNFCSSEKFCHKETRPP